ncbi:MAG TPA: ABC transporter permease [Gaiellaceae bacterium]|nr:ABC transporter permease [Gaiellaceae bacterium]
MRSRAAAWALPVVAAAAAIGVWWLLKWAFGWQTFILPSPAEVARELWSRRSYLPEQTWATLLETLEGFGLAIVVGFALAILIAYSKSLERSLYPLLVAFNAVPKLALAPILVLWMGFGSGPKVVMVLLLCVFPIVLSTATGLKSTAAELDELVRSLTATEVQAFRKVRLPAALPHVFVGLKVGISLAVIGAVIGEFVGATKGLGYVIVASGQNADTTLAFAAIAILAVMSIVLFYVLVGLERLLVPWARHQQ